MYGYCMQCSGTAHNVNLPLTSLEEVFWPAVHNQWILAFQISRSESVQLLFVGDTVRQRERERVCVCVCVCVCAHARARARACGLFTFFTRTTRQYPKGHCHYLKTRALLCQEIFASGARPAQNLEISILRLLYEMMQDELQGKFRV